MRKSLYLVIVLSFIILPMFTLAVGIQNGNWGVILFKPNQEYTFNYAVFGAEKIDAVVEGDLAQYASIKDSAPGSGARPITTILTTPATLEPGFHSLLIVAKELPTSETAMGGLAIVKVRIKVLSLYPGKYPLFSLTVRDMNVGEKGKIDVGILNYGTDTINSAQGQIEIFDPEGKSVTTLYTDKVAVGSNEEVVTSTYLDTAKYALNPGRYRAVGTLLYDGLTYPETSEVNFTIGSLKVDVVDSTKELIVNATNKYTITVESDWSGGIKDVYAKITTPNKKVLKTPNIDLVKPLENNVKATGTLETYWETTGLELGEYDMGIELYYGNKMTQKTVKVKIVDGPKPVIEKPKTLQILGYENNKLIIYNLSIPISMLLMIILALIVMFNVYYFILRKPDGSVEKVPMTQTQYNQQQGQQQNQQVNNMLFQSNSTSPNTPVNPPVHPVTHERHQATNIRPPSK